MLLKAGRLVFAFLLLGAGLLSCKPGKSSDVGETSTPDSADSGPGQESAHPYNVIMVVVDTLRARSTSLVPGSRDITPALAAWSQDQVVFDNAIATAGWTPPSIASVFSGLYMSAHGLINFVPTERYDDDIFLDEILTLPELFQEAGYRTEALSLSSVMPSERGWGQGFDVWEIEDQTTEESSSDFHKAEHLTDLTLNWLENPGEDPFFLYVHYMEPHAPYMAPSPWYDMFVSGDNVSTYDGTVAPIRELYAGSEYTDEDAQKLTSLYEGEAAYWDSQFRRIAEFLEESSLKEDTIVVVFGDHGEQMGEHGSWLHYHLWQENIHIPLVVSVPGATPGRVSQHVSLVDLAPTLASLTGISTWDAWQGEDLSAVFQGETTLEPRTLFSEFNGRWVVLSPDGWKAYYDGYERDFLHDLAADPLEADNRHDDMAEKWSELTRARYEFLSDSYAIRSRLAE